MIQASELYYSNKYTPYTRLELLDKVAEKLSPARFDHVKRVEQTALELASAYPSSFEKTSIAALTHDYAKELSTEEAKEIILSSDVNPELLAYGNPIWHGPVAAILVARDFEVKDEEILKAIEVHTTGAAEMTTLEQIIYVADYIEPARQFPVVEKARQLVGHSLAETVLFETQQTLLYLINEEQIIYPQTLVTYNSWIDKLGGNYHRE